MTDIQINVQSWPDKPNEGRHARKASKSILHELIAALKPHPRGLRRWSVMRAIRIERGLSSRDIPLKFEADVESVFRKFSAAAIDAHVRICEASEAPFCRPQDTAGEVWALRSARTDAATDGDDLSEHAPKDGAP